MDTTDANVARLDVHHKTIPYAVRCQSATGNVLEQSRSFGTMTKQRAEKEAEKGEAEKGAGTVFR